MTLKIVISSGKGGTGKTFISTNIAKISEDLGDKVNYLDCDVEEPNGHLFLKPVIKKVKENIQEGINIIDSLPEISCPVVETVKDADLCILVTDPTPFGINDLKLAVNMCRCLGQEPVVIVNRTDYMNNDLLKYCLNESLEIIGEIMDDSKILFYK